MLIIAVVVVVVVDDICYLMYIVVVLPKFSPMFLLQSQLYFLQNHDFRWGPSLAYDLLPNNKFVLCKNQAPTNGFNQIRDFIYQN